MNQKKSRLSQAMVFLILFGIVSLFSDTGLLAKNSSG